LDLAQKKAELYPWLISPLINRRANMTTIKLSYIFPQTMNIVDMAIHRVVSQKYDFHENSGFQLFPKARPFTNSSRKISGQNVLAFQIHFVARN
jgi:hypothetical protein